MYGSGLGGNQGRQVRGVIIGKLVYMQSISLNSCNLLSKEYTVYA